MMDDALRASHAEGLIDADDVEAFLEPTPADYDELYALKRAEEQVRLEDAADKLREETP